MSFEPSLKKVQPATSGDIPRHLSFYTHFFEGVMEKRSHARTTLFGSQDYKQIFE